MNDAVFSQIDFGPLTEFLQDDDITDISYSNGGQVWLKTLSKGVFQVDRPDINNAFMEKLAFQCSNVMGKTFNMAHPFLDSESAELRMNFVHDSIATNGIACLIRKTPAKIRLNKDKLMKEDYVIEKVHDFLIKCVQGHCNIIVSGETGSGKTEFVKYLASHTAENEKIITIEDTLELHLDRIFPHRDIVAMKTNNIASYTDVLVTCMRQNPKWILLSEVRSAEAVMAVRNSISSGHNILSTIHADKATSIPLRMYSLLETSQEVEQFLTTIHRYVQIGVYIKGYFSKRLNRFQREIIEVCEFYVDDDNVPQTNMIYKKSLDGTFTLHNPTAHLVDYMSIQNVILPEDVFGLGDLNEQVGDDKTDTSTPKGSALEIEKLVVPEQASTNPVINPNVNNNVNVNQQPMQNIDIQENMVKPDLMQPSPMQQALDQNVQNNNLNQQPINNVEPQVVPQVQEAPVNQVPDQVQVTPNVNLNINPTNPYAAATKKEEPVQEEVVQTIKPQFTNPDDISSVNM